MKTNCWLILGAMLSTSLLAQQATNTPAPALETPAPAAALTNVPPAPAPAAPAASNAPAKTGKKKTTTTKKKAAEKKAPAARKKEPAAELATVPLVPGPAVVEANKVNVRGQARLKSEIVARLTKGQPVTVLEEIVRNNSASDEPSAWARILLPPDTHVWVNTAYISNHVVRPKKLNVRSGAGENFSVLGTLLQGEPVKELTTKGEWTQIEAPTNAYAFVAAQYLKQLPAGAAIVSTETNPPTTTIAGTPTTVTEPPHIATTTTEIPGVSNPPPVETTSVTNPPTGPSTETPVDDTPQKRIVLREGLVRATGSIQAPTAFALYSPETGRLVDYLFTTSANLDLRRYKGLRIVVTGEEGLDERWGNTPVITIQKIQVME